jgi:hypothetical protein
LATSSDSNSSAGVATAPPYEGNQPFDRFTGPTGGYLAFVIKVVAGTATLLLLAACGHGTTGAPAAAALGFAQAVEGKQGDRACALLAPATRAQLESAEGKPCAQAVLAQDLPPSASVRKAEQYGYQSRVILDKDVVFVARFSLGWRVVAAGCQDRGKDLPYDCQISGQ